LLVGVPHVLGLTQISIRVVALILQGL